MAEITFDPELMQHIKTIYGDAELDGRTLKLIYNTWKVNPDWIRNAALLKMPRPAITNNKPMEQFNTPVLNNRTPGIAAPNPAQELALDDLSRFSSFNAAYAEAKKRGGQGFQFRWKATKANPSGLFVVLDAVSSIPSTPPSPAANSNNVPYYLKRPDDANPSLQTIDNKVGLPESNKYYTSDMFRRAGIGKTDWNNLFYHSPLRTNITVELEVPNETFHRWSPQTRDSKKFNEDADRARIAYANAHKDGEYKNFRPFLQQYQQGGTINNQEELQKAFMAYLIQDAAAQGIQLQSEQDLQAYAQQLGEEGIQAKYQEFMQRMQGGTMARLGAKLEYYRKLKGVCPDGSKPTYFEKGGRMVHKCTACEKAQKGKKLNAVEQFKNLRELDRKELKQYNKDMKSAKDEAAQDSIRINKYGDNDTADMKGHKGKMKNGVWTPDRSKYTKKNACGAKMKKTN